VRKNDEKDESLVESQNGGTVSAEMRIDNSIVMAVSITFVGAVKYSNY
jgi:hypothetical protein